MMNKQYIYTKLNKIFSFVFDKDKFIVTEEMLNTNLEDWVDSLTRTSLISEVEDCFQIQFSMDEMLNIKTLKDIINIIEKYIS